MGNHGHRDRRHGDSYVRRDDRDPRMMSGPTGYDAGPRLPRKLPIAVVLVGLVVWSLLAWTGYALVDPVLGWTAANAGVLADTGKGLATVTGGKEVGTILDNLDVGGFLGQTIALLSVVLKPAIVVVWALGALALIAAPVIVSKAGRMPARRRY